MLQKGSRENLANNQISQNSVNQIHVRVQESQNFKIDQPKLNNKGGEGGTWQKSRLPVFSQLSLSVSWALANTANDKDYEDEKEE